MATITFTGVEKRYPDQSAGAVRDLNLEVGDGEFMVFVGPSGCGKTTALRMTAGLETITAGEIAIDGEVVNNVAPQRRDVAMVFQEYALYPQMNVFDNIAFGLRLRKLPRAEVRARVEEMAQTLGMEDLLARKPRALSGGQRQRVAMGRALVRDPQGLPDGRAALQPRRQTAGADALRDRPGSSASWGRRRSTSPTTRSRR